MRYQTELRQVKWVKCMQMQLAMHCAPVLADVKPSNAVTLDFADSRELVQSLKGTEIRCALIHSDEGKCLWLLYRERQMLAYLMEKKNREFLENCGYTSFQIKNILYTLRTRYKHYKSGQGDFPHELGLILGYPLCDVEGFIENQGKDCLYSGYWKVYGNEEQTRKLFDIYDLVRYQMVKQVEYGKSIRQMVESYENYQISKYA